MNNDIETGLDRPLAASNRYVEAIELLLGTVQKLSLARSMGDITAIVRHAARKLTGADGASFVLHDNGYCYYADEEAIAPLWKGKRFPMEICISGWVMLNRKSVVIPDIYDDPRIPVAAYQPTFVKSLAMVPIRSMNPVGAIGIYWATQRTTTPEEVRLLQALADSTSVAMENVQLVVGLEEKVAERTARLQMLNEELDSFSHSVSHDLRAPLRHVDGFVNLLHQREKDKLSPKGLEYVKLISNSTRNMGQLIEDLLEFSRMGRKELQLSRVDMNALVVEVWQELEPDRRARKISWKADPLPGVKGDRAMLKQVWSNLLANAIKYSGKREQAEIEVGAAQGQNTVEFFVKDNGAGFEMEFAGKLFGVFQRLHLKEEFEGTGVGLANVRRIVTRHEGRVRAIGEKDHGATFFFTLPI